MARASEARKETRIQREKREVILKAALAEFAKNGFRGTTIDAIAAGAGLSKPNLLYYFSSKEEIYRALLCQLLDTWLEPLFRLDPEGDPIAEITGYVRRKLEMARDYPAESRLFANEILRGAPRLKDMLEGPLKEIVDREAAVIGRWAEEGRIAPVDPHHLIFSIWATTQHYADFDVQVRAVLGPDRSATRFADAEAHLVTLFERVLRRTDGNGKPPEDS